MSLLKRGKIWHAAIYDPAIQNARWQSLHTEDEEEAHRIYAEKLKERKANKSGVPVNVTWKTFKEKYFNDCRADKTPKTLKGDKSRIEALERLTHIQDSIQFTPELLNQYRTDRRLDGVEKSTVNRELGMLKKMGKKGQEYNFIDKSHDFGKVKRYGKKELSKPTRKFFEIEEIHRIKQALDEQESTFLKIGVYISLYTGMRPGEIINLKWDDIDFNQNLIHVTFKDNWRTKDVKERSIALFKPLKDVLLTYHVKSRSEYVLLTDKGKRPGEHYLARCFKRLLGTIRMDGRLYAGRHTFGTHALESHDLKTVSEMMGHASLQTTSIYLHLRKDAIKKAAEKAPF